MTGLMKFFDIAIIAIIGGTIVNALNSKHTVALFQTYSDMVVGAIRAQSGAIR